MHHSLLCGIQVGDAGRIGTRIAQGTVDSRDGHLDGLLVDNAAGPVGNKVVGTARLGRQNGTRHGKQLAPQVHGGLGGRKRPRWHAGLRYKERLRQRGDHAVAARERKLARPHAPR